MSLLKLSPVRSQNVVGCQGEISKAAVPLTGRAKVGLVRVAHGAVVGEPALFANLEHRNLPRGGTFGEAVPLIGRARSGACQGCSWGCGWVSQRRWIHR